MKPRPAESFHILHAGGGTFHVDSEVRKEVEAFLRQVSGFEDLKTFIVIESLAGEEITVVADAVDVIFSSSPESRQYYRMYHEMLDNEDALS
jgi:hypothetical protein